jgi:hypothetical protein
MKTTLCKPKTPPLTPEAKAGERREVRRNDQYTRTPRKTNPSPLAPAAAKAGGRRSRMTDELKPMFEVKDRQLATDV